MPEKIYTVNHEKLARIVTNYVRDVLASKNGTHQRDFLVPLILGPNGIGKSAVVKQVSDSLGIAFLDVRLLTAFPTDLRGMPYVQEGNVVWARPYFVPQDGQGLLFFDEFTNCGPDMQAATYELIQTGRCGTHELAPGWAIALAGNRVQHRTGARPILQGIATRVFQLELKVETPVWVRWAVANALDSRVIGYINANPQLLMKDDPDQDSQCRPRTWTDVSRQLTVQEEEDWPECFAGTIGEGEASAFLNYLKGLKLPTPTEILSGTPLPSAQAAMYTCAINTAQFIQKLSPEEVNATALSAFLRVSLRWPRDIGYFLFSALTDNNQKAKIVLMQSPYWQDWRDAYSKVVL